jgi:hypothetical protein
MMQTDVKSTQLNTSGTVFAGRARIKGFVMCANPNAAGKLILRNGGVSGTLAIEVDVPSNSNPNSFYVLVPGQGVLCSTDIYASLSGLASVTVFYA